jgi:hypothetical protein
MSDQGDGVNEAVGAALRVALTVAGRVAEQMARQREQSARAAQAASEQEARELQARMDAERSAARAALAPVAQGEWWDRAQSDEVAKAWETANAWSAVDPDAAAAVDRISSELRDRYDVDVDALRPDEAAVRDAVARRAEALREAAGQRGHAGADEAEAAAVIALADQADRDAERVEASASEPADVAALDRDAEVLADGADRHQVLAADLEGVADEEAVEARQVAAKNQARPPEEAVSAAGARAPKARRGRSGPGRAPERGVQR